MKTLLGKFAVAFAALALTSSLAVAASDWGDDYAKALAQAKAEKKMVLMDFTGSDWCPGCIHLAKEIFAKKEFKEYAKENLVLLEVDFPQGKELAKRVKEQNEKLQADYNVEGFPTVIVLNSQGKKISLTLGYEGGDVSDFIKGLKALKGK